MKSRPHSVLFFLLQNSEVFNLKQISRRAPQTPFSTGVSCLRPRQPAAERSHAAACHWNCRRSWSVDRNQKISPGVWSIISRRGKPTALRLVCRHGRLRGGAVFLKPMGKCYVWHGWISPHILFHADSGSCCRCSACMLPFIFSTFAHKFPPVRHEH